jgi:hypothetical protein
MDLYRQALLGFPQEVADKAGAILEPHAQTAFQEIHDKYPVVTGRLQAGLTLTDNSASLHPRWTLANDVVYALIFEAGGATTTGPKPGGQVFVPIAIREWKAARAEIIDMLERTVPGG